MKVCFLFLLSTTTTIGSGGGKCSFDGKVLKVVHDNENEVAFELNVSSVPKGYCACKATPAKGSTVSVYLDKKTLLAYIAEPNNQKFTQVIKSHKEQLARAKKLVEDYTGTFSARCFDGMTAEGCRGGCGAWLPE